jgi:hypothetical protein
MFIGQVKDVGACENRRRLFFRPASFCLILRYLTKLGEEAERERQLFSPMWCQEPSDCATDADDGRRIGSIWMKFDNNRLSGRCLSGIFPDIKFYTYGINDCEEVSLSSCLFIPINRYATLSEFDLIIHNLVVKIEIYLNSNTDISSAKPSFRDALPVRKPSACDWFPLPYKMKGRKKETSNFFESPARFILDVSTWICDHQLVPL